MNIDAVRPLQVLALGIGDAFSSLDYHSSLLVMGGGALCQVDCADPYHKILRERSGAASATGAALTARDIDHLLLTHLHADHCGGLESYLLYRRYVLKAPPPTIYALPEVARALWPEKLAVSLGRARIPALGIDVRSGAEDYFRMQEVTPDKPFHIGRLRFEIRRTQHLLPCFGFRVTLEDAGGGAGRSFAYSGDTIFDQELVDFLSRADVFFHECGEGPIHSPVERLAALPPEIRAKMRIMHLCDTNLDTDTLLQVVKAGQLYTV